MQTSWLKKPHVTSGEDHLATRAVCEHLYARLLPGITNSTSRVRYFSFYPWLLWRADKAGLDSATLTPVLRAADVLFTLIGLANEPNTHAMIGSNTLHVAHRNMGSDGLKLSDFTHLKPATNRYFKNPRGGLGQYYQGALELLGVLHRDGTAIQLTPERGVPIAEAVDAGVNGDAFFAAIAADRITAKTLKTLQIFSPDQLINCPAEHAALVQLMFNDSGVMASPSGQARRETFALLMDLTQEMGSTPSLRDFRAIVYSNALADGTPLNLKPSVAAQRLRWSVYQRNDMLSLAVQGLFQASLSRLRELENGVVSSMQDFGRFVTEQFFPDLPAGTVGEALEQRRAALPPLQQWAAPADDGPLVHEIQLARTIRHAARQKDRDSQNRLAQAAVSLILSLSARGSLAATPYGSLAPSPSYLIPYPINLQSLKTAENDWSTLPMAQFPSWLAQTWGVQVHLQVALRKLRQQSTDTFQIRPENGSLQVQRIPITTESNPRVSQGVSILQDLHFINTERQLTPAGSSRQGKNHA